MSRRRTIAAVLAVLALLAAGCGKSPEEARAARKEEIAQTTGSLLVKSNRPNATVEATPASASGDAAPANAKTGAVDQVIPALPPGRYAVVARAAGWPEVRGETDVVIGRTTELTLDFKSGSLRLDSVPTGATVKHGGAVLGKTPLVVPALPPGECSLTLEYPAWPVLSFKTTITENVETSGTVRLPHGRLTVETAPAGATVLLGKRSLGQTPLVLAAFPAGTVKLTLQAKEFPPQEVPVTVEDQGEAKVGRELGAGFPQLEPTALLRAVWVPENKDKLTESFDVVGKFAPKNGIVKNLDRQKVHNTWLGRKYRYTGTVKSFDRQKGEIEFAEEKGELSRYRVVARLAPAALDDPALATPVPKGATLTLSLYGTLAAAEEPRWPARNITFEIDAAELLHGDAPVSP